MAKEKKSQKNSQEMSLAQSKAYRASLHKPTAKVLSEEQKREAFRIFWASNKAKYGKLKAIEKAIWLHLKSIGMNSPEQFSQGLENFGLKKVK